MTVDEALAHAGRLLAWAEGETDLVRMERLQSLADSWRELAMVILEHERIG